MSQIRHPSDVKHNVPNQCRTARVPHDPSHVNSHDIEAEALQSDESSDPEGEGNKVQEHERNHDPIVHGVGREELLLELGVDKQHLACTLPPQRGDFYAHQKLPDGMGASSCERHCTPVESAKEQVDQVTPYTGYRGIYY